jgi:predicted GNAT family acetyltransferase
MALATEIEILEIMKRAKSGGEIVSFTENAETVKEEVRHREAKVSYHRSSGRIISMPSNKKYRENYVKIFGHD